MVARRDVDSSADTYGLTLRDITAGSTLLSHEELCALHATAVLPKRGGGRGVILDQRAFDMIVLANVRLVANRASKASRHTLGSNALDIDDLFNLGIMGLMEAVVRFNPNKGNQFSTYATWWIRQKIHRAVEDRTSIIRVPNHRHADIRKMLRTETRLWLEMERPPTDGELAKALGIRSRELHEIKESFRITKAPFRLDEPPQGMAPTLAGGGHVDDEHMTFGGCLSDPDELNQPGSDAHIEKMSRREMLDAALQHAGLTVREGAIIAARFGFGGREYTLEELGAKLKLTRERVRQIEKSSLAKLARGARQAGYGPAELHLVMPVQSKTRTATQTRKKAG